MKIHWYMALSQYWFWRSSPFAVPVILLSRPIYTTLLVNAGMTITKGHLNSRNQKLSKLGHTQPVFLWKNLPSHLLSRFLLQIRRNSSGILTWFSSGGKKNKTKPTNSTGTNNKIIGKNGSGTGPCLQFPLGSLGVHYSASCCAETQKNPWCVFEAEMVNVPNDKSTS